MRLLKKYLLTIVAVLFLLPVATTFGQADQSGSGISISPLHNQFSLNPGETKTLTLTLKNITSGSIVARPFINDFVSDNTTGNPVIITDPNKKTPTSIRDFVSGLADVPLAKAEQKKVNVALKIPQNASPGGYYGIIRYQAIPVSSPGAQPGQVSLSASVGTIVLVQVKGDLIEKLQLLGVKIYSKEREGVLFFNKPDKIGVELRNLGNSFAQPFGKIVIEKMDGKDVYSYEFNNTEPRSTILPGTKRTYKDAIKNINSPGRYTLNTSISYSSGSDILVAQKTFWYIPAWLLIVVVVVSLALTVLVYRTFHRTRSTKKRLKKLRK